MKINIDCKELASKLADLTCDKCGAEPWQCHECEITAEINKILKDNILKTEYIIEL